MIVFINRCNKLALDNGNYNVDECFSFTAVVKPLMNYSVKAVALGTSHTAILLIDGRCFTFGSNSFGQLGYQRGSGSRMPQCVDSLIEEKLDHISCGDTFTVAVSSNNRVYTWGKGARGRLGNGSEEDCPFPKLISMPSQLKVLSVSCSHSSTLICGKVVQRTSIDHSS